MKQRRLLLTGLIAVGLLAGGLFLLGRVDQEEAMNIDVSGAIRDVHDPAMIKEGDDYYIFHTGTGTPRKHSTDMNVWQTPTGSSVFSGVPEGTLDWVPGATSIWAPDISFFNDRYHLYYSVSTFGSSRSAIGLATNVTLDARADDYEWVDHGIAVRSDHGSNYNAIDANLILDADDEPWLVFGSHWSGIKMIRLDAETGKQSEEDDTLYDVASRAEHPRAVEAPFMVYREPYYYLFVSFDQCCQGSDSTYNVRVGRSQAVTGPFVDRDGVDMMRDGGTQITFPDERYAGPGHNAIFREDGQDYIVYHAYDKLQGGTPTLRIAGLEYDDEGWPHVHGMEPPEGS